MRPGGSGWERVPVCVRARACVELEVLRGLGRRLIGDVGSRPGWKLRGKRGGGEREGACFYRLVLGSRSKDFPPVSKGWRKGALSGDTDTGASYNQHRQRRGRFLSYKGRGRCFWKMGPGHRPLRLGLQTQSLPLPSALLAASRGPQRRGGQGGHLGRDHLTRGSFGDTWHFSDKLP